MLRVYYLRLSDFENFPEERLLDYVSGETAAVVGNFKNEKARRTKLLGEGMIRHLLQRHYGLPATACQLMKGPHGKPFLAGAGDIHFNLSHSGGYIVCVLARQEVGIDIEKTGKLRLEVARRFFHPDEVGKLGEMTDPQQQTGLFYSYWSVKESYLKYTGTGLAASLSGFRVCFEKGQIRIEKENTPVGVFIRECPVDPAYKCFVCSGYPETPVQIAPFRFTP